MHRACRRSWTIVVVASAFVANAATCALADERVLRGSASPDKKWELRRTDIDEAAAENGVDSDRSIVRAGTTKPVVELPLHVGESDAADRETRLVWAPDSKRFAYNYRAGGRYETTVVYQLRNGRWKELRSLEAEEISALLNRVQTKQLADLKLPKDTYRRRIWDTFQVARWKDARTAILYVYSAEAVTNTEGDEEQIEDLSAHFLFTIRFDDRGNWKVIKSHEMSAKEIEAHTGSKEAAAPDGE